MTGPRMWDLDDLVSPADIADQFRVGKAAVSNWIARHADFPKPLTTVARGQTDLYSRKAVADWHSAWARQHAGPYSKR